MNIAHTNTRTVEAARVTGSSFVRGLVLCCVLAAAGLPAAHAGPGDKEREERAAQLQRERQQAQRQYDTRGFEARAEEQRRQVQAQQEQNAQNAQNNDANRRSGRLTPDERRDLRRQINEAGADLYPKTPRR